MASGLRQYLAEHARPSDFELAGNAGRHVPPVLVHDLHLHARQRRADGASATLAVQRIGQRHADLRHSVALQQHVAADFAPAVEHAHRQGRGTGHHQPHRVASVGHRLPALSGRALPCGDELRVDRGHRHEQRQASGGDRVPRGVRVECRQHLARGAGPQRTRQDVDDAVHVIERQDVQNAVLRPPVPRGHQALHLRFEVRVRQHHAFRLPGGAARVQDEGVRPIDPAPCPAAPEMGSGVIIRGGIPLPTPFSGWRQAVARQVRKLIRCGDPGTLASDGCPHRCRVFRIDHDQVRLRVGNRMGPLCGRLSTRKRNANRTGTPDAPLHGDVLEARTHEVGDT